MDTAANGPGCSTRSVVSSPWPGWDQPTLHSTTVPPDAFEVGRVELPPRPVREGPVEALTLVADGDCSPQCLVAPPAPPAGCDCTCRGVYHGALAHTQVSSGTLARLHAG